MNKSWGKIVIFAGPLLLIILLVSYFTDGWKAFPPALVAWGTILLAFSTWLSVKNSNERESQHREDEINRERRQRDKFELDAIKEWIFFILKCNVLNEFNASLHANDGEQTRKYIKSEYLSLSQRLDTALADSLYFARIASLYNEPLRKAIQDFITEIQERLRIIALCIGCINVNDFPGFIVAKKELDIQNPKFISAADNVIKQIVEIKSKILDI